MCGALLAFSACGAEPTLPSPVVTRVDVSPAEVTLTALGETRAFTAVAKDAAGATMSGQAFTWSSSAPGVASVDADGVVTAVGNGTAAITARTAGVSGSASLEVGQRAAAVEVTPAADTLTFIGDTLRLNALAKDGGENEIADQAFTWLSSNPSAATVDATGLVTARAPGEATITAVASGVPGSASVAVDVFLSVSAGELHACGVTTSGAAYCWGSNEFGQLGTGTSGAGQGSVVPVAVIGGLRFVAVSAGGVHTCGVTTEGTGYCWGLGAEGVLGDGTSTGRASPGPVDGGLTFVQLSSGERYTCGVTTTGDAYCWGSNLSGQLGDATTTRRRIPTLVSGGLRFMSVAAGYQHTCGVTTAGDAYCWGQNAYGKLGDSTTTQSSVPVLVVGGLSFTSVGAGAWTTCGVTIDAAVYCWGWNNYGNFGDGTQEGSLTPVPGGGGVSAMMVVPRYTHTCALGADGGAYCWGDHRVGQLGGGSLGGTSFLPVRAGDLTFVSVTAGNLGDLGAQDAYSCGVAVDGAAYCWGGNSVGQLGVGYASYDEPEPTRVRR